MQEIAAAGVTCLIVEQNVHGALLISQTAIVMELGRKFMEGPAEIVRHDPRIREAYLGGNIKEDSTGMKAARLAVDIGGTFTDFAIESGGRRWTHKLLTTSRAPEIAVLEGTKQILADAGLRAADLSTVIHGTTLATNAVIERKGAKTALLVTEGFRELRRDGVRESLRAIRHLDGAAAAAGAAEFALAGP